MSTLTHESSAFDWKTQQPAADLIHQMVEDFLSRCSSAKALADRLLNETGTRFVDWIDHMMDPLPGMAQTASRMEEVGYIYHPKTMWWSHPNGIFPPIFLENGEPVVLALKVESITQFLLAHGLNGVCEIVGDPMAPMRSAKVFTGQNAEMWVVERHGSMAGQNMHRAKIRHILPVYESFRLRARLLKEDEEGFARTASLIDQAVRDVGVQYACDAFFTAEREYWMSRNHAARVQYQRQQRLGMGWANHDHHTYRSSRECFVHLIASLEKLGLVCRERFYAGREAGWGAQVLEQPNTGIVVFADVDLSPEEVTEDFAHEPLPARDEWGTVGLWCKLHGESFLQAGMHHLECQFDFDTARSQLKAMGVPSMAPFTDLPHLKQCFTEGEIWPVDSQRLQTALRAGAISQAEADRFRQNGAIGSHLEILERNAGYKGFNQSGINEIIRNTDPRKVHDEAVAGA